MKVNKQAILELKEKGLTAKEISVKLKLPYASVFYHYDEDNRNNVIKKNAIYQKKNKPKRGDAYREYQRKYHKEWYKKKEKKE